ncbi:MAG: hypothetical protein EP319_11720 [Deltaproteobacteria bacterium]|nr:MAG: hypothetical protein EP319_11720 [Deltaproteobacteria bacterium]
MKKSALIGFVALSLTLTACGKKKEEATINGQEPASYYSQFMSSYQTEKALENISNPRDVLYLYNDKYFLHMTDRRGTYRGNWKLEGNQLILGNYALASGLNFNGSDCLNLSTAFESAIFCPRTSL